MTPRETVEAYYDALRGGDPLVPFFADREDVVKVGVRERLVGRDAVVRGLRSQTRATADWTVDSTDLSVARVGPDAARFSDAVGLAWTNEETGQRRRFETRWDGVLERRNGAWALVSLHVSAPAELPS
ncbi:MAG: nuclear transport factor 2 family protein [Halobacteriaceae archaeon]